MKKCTKCSRELRKEAKFCDECGEETSLTGGGNLSISDMISWQRNIKKDIDLNKPDEELTPEELAHKAIYFALDKTVEDTLGEEKKKEIDNLIEKEDSASRLGESAIKLVEVGKEIEKNLIVQKSYVTVFFEKEPENHFKFVVNRMADEMLRKDSLIPDERVSIAEKILELVKVYRGKFLNEVVAKQEIVSSLLPTFEDKLNEIIKYEDENFSDIKTYAQRWLQLTKELLPFRNKVVEAVKENLEMEEMVPNMVIKHKGDISKTTSGMEMFTKGDRVAKLTREAVSGENKIYEERTKVSEWLFGKEEEYMDFLNNQEIEQTPDINQPRERNNSWKWGVVIVLSIIALSGGIWTAIGVFILGVIIINILSK